MLRVDLYDVVSFYDGASNEHGTLIVVLGGYRTETWGTGHIRVNVITN